MQLLDHLIMMSFNLPPYLCQIIFPRLSHVLFLIYVDIQVVVSNSIQIGDMGKTLRLLKATTADAGSYNCKAINIAGSTEKDFFLDVLSE